MSDGLELAISAIIAAVLVAGSAYVTHRIDAGKIETLKASYANQESARNKQLLADYADAVQQRDNLQKSADAAASDAVANIAKATNETNQLRTCIDSGHGCGLRIHIAAVAPASASGAAVSEAIGASDAEYAELAPDARSAYFTLRTAIIAVQGQLEACKGYAAQMAK